MQDLDEIWRPGSFTKNFAWGSEKGLEQLYESIRIGFDQKLREVPRHVFRQRVASHGKPDYIPLNFFLFNRPRDGIDYLIVDELVFQAVTARHSVRFDKLALFAFNLSIAGRWLGAEPYQQRPALWAHHYVRDRVAHDLAWETGQVSADDIETFVTSDKRYRAEGARKLSTNLNYLYRIGRLSEFATEKIERWWIDSLFLALDRIISDRRLNDRPTPQSRYGALLDEFGFVDLTGKHSLEKRLATRHLIDLYRECGGPERFCSETVATLVEELTHQELQPSLEHEPSAAIHPTNLRIIKTIPAMCAMLAVVAGFDVLTAVQLQDFDSDRYLRNKTREALEKIEAQQIRPMMSVDEILILTRGS